MFITITQMHKFLVLSFKNYLLDILGLEKSVEMAKA